jgi:aminoglycoside phosphotransferase (APT) family kinase protein
LEGITQPPDPSFIYALPQGEIATSAETSMSEETSTLSPSGTPAPEFDVDVALVHELLSNQHPDLAGLPLEALDAGWDNAMFRLGEHLVVRLPRRAIAAPLIEHEQTWLPMLADRLPIAIPAPERVGRPGCGYPWHWSVVPWLPGEPGDIEAPDSDQAGALAAFLRALHVDAPAQAPRNPFRGVPLASRNDVVQARIERLAADTSVITERVVDAWETALSAPTDNHACWIHGDLHARNVLVHHGTISAVIDWGDICAGDRATDLAAVWMLLDQRQARLRAMRDYGPVPAATWLRALGWAVSFGTVLLETGMADHPRHAQMGQDILRRIDDGPNALDL